MLARDLSGRNRKLVARLRDRILYRVNSLLGIDTPLFSFYRGVAALQTVLHRHSTPRVQGGEYIDEKDNRCLSAIVFLNEDFEGGELNFHSTTKDNPKEKNLNKLPKIGSVKGKVGRLSIFLSQTIHSVSPVTNGYRDSFFVWITCNPDKKENLEML